MAFTAFRDMKPFPQLIIALFVILVCFLASMLVSILVALPIFGLNAVMEMGNLDLGNPESLVLLKYFQVVQSIGLFVLPPIVLGWLYYGNIPKYLYIDKSFNGASFLLVLVLMFFAAPFINFAGEINANMSLPPWLSGVENWMRDAEDKAAEITEAFLNVKTIPGLAFNIFMIAFLPAIGEELLFRGVIQKLFTKMTRNHHWGIWISAILFSALHMQFYGFIPRMLLGVLFGYLLVWSGSMWLPILAHFFNNGFAVVAIFLINKEMLNPDIEEIGSSQESYYAAAISLVLIVVFMWLFIRQNQGSQITLK